MAWSPQKRIAATIGVIGLAIEIVAIWLLAAKLAPVAVAMPILIAGMFVAFVPLFVMSRRSRR